MRKALLLTVMMITLACYAQIARTESSSPVGSGPSAAQEPSASSKVKFSVGEPETVISFERMKDVDVRGIDGSLYGLNDNGQWNESGINWSEWQIVHEDNHLHDYPSIVSTGDDNEVLGKSFWVYYKYCFDDILPKWNWYKNRWDRVLVTVE
jgi:hypothetical protein